VSEDPTSREARNTMRHLRHELRTPIGQIVGYSELLQEEAQESGREDTIPDLERIRQAALGLLQRVDEVLGGDASRAEESEEEQRNVPPSAASEPARSAGGRILVVDDDPVNRDLLTRRLEREGHSVQNAPDGAEALRALAEGGFDLVLLDVLMPGMSGLEVLRAIRRERPLAGLPVILATALDGSDHVVDGLGLGASDHVTKPFDMPVVMARVAAQLALKRANDEIQSLARNLEIRNAFIRRVFGRYVSDDIVDTLLEQPEALDLRGESRRVTVLVADLRGFSSLTAECSPSEVLAVLNGYLGAMSEIIQDHGGIVDDFFGDGILAFIGAPITRADHALQGVRCAVAMQLALPAVNRENGRQGLPEVEMGIGVATGTVIVGSMGSERRAKYGAIGLPVNLASRIESFTLGGEVLIDDQTWLAVGDAVRIADSRDVHPKGFETSLRIHRVAGLREGEGLDRDALGGGRLFALGRPVPVEVALLEGKRVSRASFPGRLRELSFSAARVECAESVPEMTDVRLSFLDAAEHGLRGSCYARVVSESDEGGNTFTVRFTARPSELQRQIRRLVSEASATNSPSPV